jgi:CIC family chloride channel protein
MVMPDDAVVSEPPALPTLHAPTLNARVDRILSDISDDEDRLPKRPLQWLGLMITASLVGAVAGLVGAAFRISLSHAGQFRDRAINFSHLHLHRGFGWTIPTVLCALGAGLGTWLTQRLAPQSAGSGIPRVEAVIRNHLRPAGAMILLVKFVGGTLSIGSGLALGREGPTVQMGGTLGRLIGDPLRRFVAEPWTLIAAGAGAGLAVAFNAPLAAVLFAVEELIHRFSARVFSATLAACIAGTLVLRAIIGNTPDFGVATLSTVPVDVLPDYLVLGVLAGLFGVAFNMTLLGTLNLFDRTRRWPAGTRGAMVGAAVGLLASSHPGIVGGGENIAQHAIIGNLAWRALAGLLCVRFALTMVSYGSGAPGGIFAPLLAMGALLGNAFSAVNATLRHAPYDPATYAIVAMAACFTAIVRSPLTGVVLILEMTGSWTLILPMMAASITAYAVPELLGNPPIYDSLRERDERAEKVADLTGSKAV